MQKIFESILVRRGVLSAVCAIALVSAIAFVPGCLVASKNRVHIEGREVAASELSNIKPTVTTEQEVPERFGPATASTPMSDGGIMHSWTATRREERNGAVFLIFAGSSEKTTRQTVAVTCKDGIVSAINVR